MKSDETSWISTIFQGVVGNLGVEGDHSPKMCAGLVPRLCSAALRPFQAVQAMAPDTAHTVRRAPSIYPRKEGAGRRQVLP